MRSKETGEAGEREAKGRALCQCPRAAWPREAARASALQGVVVLDDLELGLDLDSEIGVNFKVPMADQ